MPKTSFAAYTAGENIPNLACLPPAMYNSDLLFECVRGCAVAVDARVANEEPRADPTDGANADAEATNKARSNCNSFMIRSTSS